MQTAGPDANPGAVTNVEVLIDTNRDGEPDYLVYDAKSAAVDATLATTVDLATGKTVDAQPLNGGAPGQDVNTFDSSVKVLTVGSIGHRCVEGVRLHRADRVGLRAGCRHQRVLGGGRDQGGHLRPVEAGAVVLAGRRHRRAVRRRRLAPVTRASGVTKATVLVLHLDNAAGKQADTSTIKVIPPTLALAKGSKVTVSGKAKVGSNLTAKHGNWSTTKATYKYQWLRDGKVVKSATGTKYKLGSSDAGHRMSVRVTAHASGYADGTAKSGATPKVTRR